MGRGVPTSDSSIIEYSDFQCYRNQHLGLIISRVFSHGENSSCVRRENHKPPPRTTKPHLSSTTLQASTSQNAFLVPAWDTSPPLMRTSTGLTNNINNALFTSSRFHKERNTPPSWYSVRSSSAGGAGLDPPALLFPEEEEAWQDKRGHGRGYLT